MTEIFDFYIPVECFKQVCRVCLKQSECLISVHEVVITHNHNTQGIVQGMMLSIVLNKYCKVSVHKEDLKPQNICMPCVEMIAKAFDIFEQFLMSDIHLDKILRQHASKLAKENEENTLNVPNVLDTIPSKTRSILIKRETIPAGSEGYVDQRIEKMNEDDSISKMLVTSDHTDISIEAQENNAVIGDSKSENIVIGLPAKIKRNISTDSNVDSVIHQIDSKIFHTSSKSEISSEAQENIVISDSELNDNFNNIDEFSLQHLKDEVEFEGFDCEDTTHKESESKSPHMHMSSVIVSPPNTGREKWDHTYYSRETKFLNTMRRQIRRRKSKQPSSSKPKVNNELIQKKMLLAFKRKNEIFNCKFCKGILFQGMDSVIKHLQSVHPLEDECILCDKKFSKIKLLVAHVASHAKKRHLVCNKCLIFFKDKESLEAHTASEDHIKNTTTCNICSKSFKQHFKLTSHIQEVHLNTGKQKTQCPKCGIILKYKGNLQKHLRTHREISERKSFLCEHCAKVFTTSTHLKRHVLIEHEGQIHLKERSRIKAREARRKYKERFPPKNSDNVYTCEYCPKTFTFRGPFFKHRISHPECKDIACPFCGKMCDSARAYKNHRVADHSSHLCSICQKGWPTKMSLSQHMYNAHKASTFQFPPKNSDNVYTCEYCPKTFTFRGPFFKHRISHPECKDIACPFCGKMCDSARAYKNHRVTDHSSHLCSICQKGWPTKMSLSQHMYNAHKASTFQCTFCPARFKSSQSLKLHENIHTQVKPYSCQYCGKKFTQNNHVIQHEVCMHTKMKKHQCHICDKAFQYNYTLQAHIRSHFGFKPFKCPYCSKKFTDTVGRHKHVKYFHPEKMDDFTLFKKKYQGNEIMLADAIDVKSENGDNIEDFPEKHSSFTRPRKRAVSIEQAEGNENEEVEEYEMIDSIEASSYENEAPFSGISNIF